MMNLARCFKWSLCLAVFSAGCTTPMERPRLEIDLSALPDDIFIEERLADQPVGRLDVDEAVRRAIERDPEMAVLREAVNVAWAQARTYVDWRDPELGLTFGQGTREVERSWLVPRTEIMPALAYPSDGIFLTTHEENLAVSTDPRVPRVVVPPGGEKEYLERSSRTYRGTTAESDMFRASIRFFPPNPWITRSRGAAAQANYAAAAAGLLGAEWQLRCRVRRLFARLQYLEKDAAHLRELVAVRKAVSESVTELAAEQQMSIVETVGAAQRHLEALSELDQCEEAIALLRNELEGLVGHAVEIGGDAYPEEVLTTVEDARQMDLRKRTLENRRDIATAYWRAQVAQALLSQARAARIPWFTQVQGSYGRSSRKDRPDQAWELRGGYAELDTDTAISVDETEDSDWRIETAIIIPLFSQGGRATRVQEAECKRAIAELGATARSAMQALTDAFFVLESAEQRDARVVQELAPRLDHTRAVLQLLRDQGGVGPIEQARLKEVAIEMLRMSARSRFDLIEAALRLEQTVGAPLEHMDEAAPEEAGASEPEEQEEEAPMIRKPTRLRRGIHR